MKTLLMMFITIFLLCSYSDSKIDEFDVDKYTNDGFIKIPIDSPTTISWGSSPFVKKYLLYYRTDHDDTVWIVVDSIFPNDTVSSYSYFLPRSALTEEDTLFYLTIQSINNDGTYKNNIHYFVDSTVSFSNWLMWHTRVIPLKPFPMRVRYYE